MNNREFLERMSDMDCFLEHDDNCGHCATQQIMAQTARDFLAKNDTEDGIAKWSEEYRRRWQETKFFKLYQEEVAAGREPHKAFKDRGWEM